MTFPQNKEDIIYFENEIFLFLENCLRNLIKRIIPSKEIIFLPPNLLEVHDMYVFHDYLFVINKFLLSHIPHQKYTPFYSSKVMQQLKDDEVKKEVYRIIKYFESGNPQINNKSFNILPPSANRYFKKPFFGGRNRYCMDFIADSWGIRHAHLSSHNNDLLLYYILVKQKVVLISIGPHKEIVRKENLKIIIDEFPECLEDLGIRELTGIDPGIESAEDEIRMSFKNNMPFSPTINGKVYLITPMTFSGGNTRLISELQNIIFQVKSQTENFSKCLNSYYKLYIVKSTSKLSIKYGGICIGDRISGQKCNVFIPYLKRIQIVENILSTVGND